jgi:tetratricopeptide (TPR) repeat protein
MQMEGMSLVLYPNKQPDAINIDKTHDLYWNVFKFRGVNDSTLHKDENASRLVNNYISGFMVLADTLQKVGRVDEAAAEVYKAIEVVGGGMDPWAYLCRMYTLHDRLEDAERVREEAPDKISKDQLGMFIATALKDYGRKEEARTYLEDIYSRLPDSRDVFNELFRLYYQERLQVELVTLLRDWTTRHPEDRDIREAYDQLVKEVPGLPPVGSLGTDSSSPEEVPPESGAGQ